MARPIWLTVEDLRASGVDPDELMRACNEGLREACAAADIELDADGLPRLTDGLESARAAILRRLEKLAVQAAERRARERRTWSLGLSRWIDRWTPFYIAPHDLVANDEKLASALRCIASTPHVTVPRA